MLKGERLVENKIKKKQFFVEFLLLTSQMHHRGGDTKKHQNAASAMGGVFSQWKYVVHDEKTMFLTWDACQVHSIDSNELQGRYPLIGLLVWAQKKKLNPRVQNVNLIPDFFKIHP